MKVIFVIFIDEEIFLCSKFQKFGFGFTYSNLLVYFFLVQNAAAGAGWYLGLVFERTEVEGNVRALAGN